MYSNNRGSISDPYYKPGATIHIVAGMSGRSAYDGLVEPKPVWSAYREVAYGYTIFEATPTSINYKFIRNSDGNVADDFWIVNTIDVDLPIEIPNNNTIKFLLISRILWDKGIAEFIEASRIIKNKHNNYKE